MPVVALARDDVITHNVWCLCNIWTEFVRKAVGDILLVARMVGVNAHLAVEGQRRVRLCHERAVYRNLMQIDANTVELSVTVKEHTELEKRVWRIFDTRYQATR